MKLLREIVKRNRAGEAVALTAVCSAHPDVLAAALLLARDMGKVLLIEATSNQVNQFGGYTGMTPADFIAHVRGFMSRLRLAPEQIAFGGDHLGPQAWRRESAEIAMAKAREMVAAYVRAGFSKIHLDCSEGCLGEPANVGDQVAAERAADLAAICDSAADDVSYIIGTEVPPPGGARADAHDVLSVTTAERAAATLAHHQAAFRQRGLDAAFGRVAGLVVQPGVEFGPEAIDLFDPARFGNLGSALALHPSLAFEAHSTDYQPDQVFVDLARRHFAILKVGPALTFAYRRAVYALDAIVQFANPRTARKALTDTMEDQMRAHPAHWQAHYAGTEAHQKMLRHFAYADRIRYYWNAPQAAAAVSTLEADFDALNPASIVLRQHFSLPVLERAEDLRSAGNSPSKALILAEIQATLQPYLVVAPDFGSGS